MEVVSSPGSPKVQGLHPYLLFTAPVLFLFHYVLENNKYSLIAKLGDLNYSPNLLLEFR